MQLNLFQTDARMVKAGYACPCGCRPTVTYERGAEVARSHCCCGNEFAVGPGAEATLLPRDGFAPESESRMAGWGEPVVAAWLVGPSVHPAPAGGHDHHDDHGTDGGDTDRAFDPVCGMRVDRAEAKAKGLHLVHAGIEYDFCGKGCFLDFRDDPERILDPAYIPSM